MVGAFEGDLIRPLGLVTLYAAYAEGEIDELLGALPRLNLSVMPNASGQLAASSLMPSCLSAG
jgi:hypothetical protein